MVLKIILLLSYILSAVISIKLILENRDPSKTIIWILIFMLFPVVGIIIYVILGRNIRKLKINKASKMADNMKKENILFNLDEMKELAKGQSSMIKEGKLPGYENKDFRVLKIISLLLNTGIFPFTINNNIEIYVDGNEKFYNLIKDIRNAKDHIHLEYFIIKDSEIGCKIKKIFSEFRFIPFLFCSISGFWRILLHPDYIQIYQFNPSRSPGYIHAVPDNRSRIKNTDLIPPSYKFPGQLGRTESSRSRYWLIVSCDYRYFHYIFLINNRNKHRQAQSNRQVKERYFLKIEEI